MIDVRIMFLEPGMDDQSWFEIDSISVTAMPMVGHKLVLGKERAGMVTHVIWSPLLHGDPRALFPVLFVINEHAPDQLQ